MSTITAIASTDTVVTALGTTVPANFTVVATHFISGTAPTSPSAGWIWIDNTTATAWVMKVYDGTDWIALPWTVNTSANTIAGTGTSQAANLDFASTYKCTSLASGSASGDSYTYGQASARVQAQCIRLGITTGTVATSENTYALICPAGITVLACKIISDTGVTANDTNYWSFQLRNTTASVDLYAAAKTTKVTGGTAITAGTVYDLAGTLQNSTPAAGDVLQFQITKTASATTMTTVSVELTYKQAA